MSTFVVECDEATWQKAGLARMDDAQSRAYCERVSHRISTGTLWSRTSRSGGSSVVIQRSWFSGKFVLIGDALRTVHFSIGSGTRLGSRMRFALDRAFGEAGEDVRARSRRSSASAGRSWKNCSPLRTRARIGTSVFPEKMREAPWRLAYDYMTRSGRMTDSRLRELAPRFMRRVERRERRKLMRGVLHSRLRPDPRMDWPRRSSHRSSAISSCKSPAGRKFRRNRRAFPAGLHRPRRKFIARALALRGSSPRSTWTDGAGSKAHMSSLAAAHFL